MRCNCVWRLHMCSKPLLCRLQLCSARTHIVLLTHPLNHTPPHLALPPRSTQALRGRLTAVLTACVQPTLQHASARPTSSAPPVPAAPGSPTAQVCREGTQLKFYNDSKVSTFLGTLIVEL